MYSKKNLIDTIKKYKKDNFTTTGKNKQDLIKIINKYNIELITSDEKNIIADDNIETNKLYLSLSKMKTKIAIDKIKELFKKKMSPYKSKLYLRISYKILRNIYTNDKTLSVKLSMIRKIISEHQEKNIYTLSKNDKYFNLPQDVRSKIKRDYQESVENKNENYLEINKKELLEKVNEISKSKNNIDKILLLLISSGARAFGLLHLNKYSKTTDDSINVSCIAKKTGDSSKLDKVNRKLLFINSDKFLSLVSEVRRNTKNILSDGSLNNNLLQKINRRFVKIFGKNYGRYKSSLLRKLYGLLSYEKYGKDINFNLYLKKVLCHNNINTSFSYSFIKFI